MNMRGPFTISGRSATGRADEAYATLPDHVFAWSNSEELLRGVIERVGAGEGGLTAVPAFRTVRDRLPASAFISLYVNPRSIDRWTAGAASRKAERGAGLALLKGHLAAVTYAGAALEWRDGLVLRTEEALDPARLNAGLKRWAGHAERPTEAFRRVPRTALAMASVDVDFAGLLDAVLALVPDEARPRVETMFLAFNGLLLGRDAQSELPPQARPRRTPPRRPAPNRRARRPAAPGPDGSDRAGRGRGRSRPGARERLPDLPRVLRAR